MLLRDYLKTSDTKFLYHSSSDGCNNSTQKAHLHQQRKAALADAADVGLRCCTSPACAPCVTVPNKGWIPREQQQLLGLGLGLGVGGGKRTIGQGLRPGCVAVLA